MNRISLAEARAYVSQWRAWFRLAPASVCLTLMEIESSFRPDSHAVPDAAAIARGVPPEGAWGLLQLLPPTAADMVAKVRRRLNSAPPPAPFSNPAETLRLWEPGHPQCLTNPALGSLLGIAYLDQLAERFGPELERLAAAYHNGPGFLRAFLAAGKKLPDDLPPKGKAYVLKARETVLKYFDEDDDQDSIVTPPRGTPIPRS